MRVLFTCIILVSVALLAGACSKPEPTTYDLYFLGGQSNMEGYGFVDQLPSDAVTQSADVMIFAGQRALDNEVHGGVGIWQPLEPGIETVQQAQQEFVDTDPCAAYVTVTDELPYLDDGWHYDSEGFIRLGTAFAEAMIELRRTCAPSE